MRRLFLLLLVICLLIERKKSHLYIIVPQNVIHNCCRVNFTLSFFLRTGSSFSENWDVAYNIEFFVSVKFCL